ncbi:hypothetical protein ACFXON_24550, partial [Bacillus subtilis]
DVLLLVPLTAAGPAARPIDIETTADTAGMSFTNQEDGTRELYGYGPRRVEPPIPLGAASNTEVTVRISGDEITVIIGGVEQHARLV